ncbi:seven-hairpin glycosidase [Ascobolus immersus RN42]|uniref:alpha-1,2-Mannosidase n=1 Tax=Ascobolus immersus RN42 TaxID=1160509 RepID=A0A3N4HJ07_ASCIM|nr:seven-hairpin glycosidase [Ascobolus immersus RN42]
MRLLFRPPVLSVVGLSSILLTLTTAQSTTRNDAVCLNNNATTSLLPTFNNPLLQITAFNTTSFNTTSPTHNTTSNTTLPLTNAAKKAHIVAAFRHSWSAYIAHAWGHDTLLPISRTHFDNHNGWGVTIIDSLDTAIMMGLDDIVAKQLEWIESVDFTTSKSGQMCSLFETSIRYLGGLLAAYDLLQGPYRDLLDRVSEDPEAKLRMLLRQAKSLADTLTFAFDTPTGIPYNWLDLRTRRAEELRDVALLAEAGTLILEWTRLSDALLSALPSNATEAEKAACRKYAELALKAQEHLVNPQPDGAEVWPGLVGGKVSIEDGEFMNTVGGWGSGSDSFYEYLIKTSLYSPSRFSGFGKRWIQAVESTAKHLLIHPHGHPEVTMVAGYAGEEVGGSMTHLACFMGGNWILGGVALNRSDVVSWGEKVVEGCRFVYNSSATGLGAEDWTVGEFTFLPEAEVEDVEVDLEGLDEGWRMDGMESWWMGETLKYLYLIFEFGEERVSVKPGEGWVFTTEGHPLRVVG